MSDTTIPSPPDAPDAVRVPTIAVIVGSTRQNRVGRAVADQVAEIARLRSEANVEMLDLADVDLPFFDEPNPPAQGNYTMESTKAWAQRIAAFDAFIIVSPEYNGGYPAVLKNALDTVWGEWNGKPFQLVTYGFHGGTSVADQLRMVISRLRGDLVEPVVTITIGAAERNEDGSIRNACAVVEKHRAEIEVGFASLHTKLGC